MKYGFVFYALTIIGGACLVIYAANEKNVGLGIVGIIMFCVPSEIYQ